MEREIEDFILFKRGEGCLPDTERDYRVKIGWLAACLRSAGVRQWRDARPEHVDGFLEHLTRRRLAFSSRERTVICARAFLRWLAENGTILADPSRHILTPKPDADDLPLPEPPLSEAQVAGLLASMSRRNAVDLRNVAVVELLYSAALRRSEAIKLNLKDVDLERRVLHVDGKGNKKRDLPIMRGLHGALRDYLVLRRSLLRGPDHGAFLLTQRGTRLSKAGVQRIFDNLNKAGGAGGRHVHAHLMRHSLAVGLLRGGADIRYIQAFLGHDSLESTKIYLRLVPADLREAYDKAMPEIAVDGR